MKQSVTLLLKIKFLETLTSKLLEYGWAGIFGIALLDSAFIPIPSGPDALVILLSSQSTAARIWIYILSATLGSTIGCTILYLIARRGGETVLKHVSEERRNRIQGLLGRYDVFALIFASLMPPPFPFKPFILSAGVFNFRLPRFIVALFLGRALRYFILGALALYFGESAMGLIKAHGPKLLIALVAAGALFLAVRYFMKINHRGTEKA